MFILTANRKSFSEISDFNVNSSCTAILLNQGVLAHTESVGLSKM